MKAIRPVLAALLTALIIVTSQGMAFARGQTMVASQIVLCTGHGFQVVSLNKDGAPIETTHLCPDCALSSVVDIPAQAGGPIWPAQTSDAVFWIAKGPTWSEVAIAPSARGPPVFL
ncbi:hypothetical protein [Nereida sp. MMG025]|uniref:hypothetical protein n=1 Tax=Nereida sp. MMG025 TaxID=2909981 RepID=UPI001F37B7D4|nr:hypothetical protein [Nereida sp. MMG025]MCF6444028.1 hypothetical protein [Nereida sp. MMG025]